MSEYHTQQLRLAEYEMLYSDALDRIDEEERLINRLERQNEATNEQINNLKATYERQNNQFISVTNQLQSNLKQQEQRYQEEIKATRKEHVKNLQNVASNFKTQIGDFKNQVANQFATERKNTKAMVDKVQQDSRKMINGVRQELSNKLKEQDQKINKIDIKVDNLKSDVDKLKDQDQNAALLAKNYYDDIKFLIEQEEKSDISLFKKQSYWKDNNSPLADLRQRLEIIKGQIDSNNNQIAASASLELYLQYDSHRKHINISHQHVLEQYRAFLSEYKSLLNAAENSQKVKINGINPISLSYDVDTKKWNDESQEIEIDVDFWTGGKLKAFVDKHKPQYEKLNTPERERNIQIDEKFIESLREKILGEEKSAQSEYEAIVKEAKELALTSNLREVLAEKALNRLKDNYKGSCLVIEKGFELNDPKNNYHLRLRIDGVERHLILGNNKDTKTITRTIMEGNDYTGNKEAFQKALNDQINVMNEAGLKLETTGEAIQNHSGACASAKDFISKGMTEEIKQSVGISLK